MSRINDIHRRLIRNETIVVPTMRETVRRLSEVADCCRSRCFDTIDHNILITRLSSWFGIHGPVLKSSHTCPLALSVFSAATTYPPPAHPLVAFLKVLSLALYFLSCTPPH